MLTYYTDSGLSGSEFSSTGLFDFGPGVDRIDFTPTDALGDPTYEPDPFFFGLSVDTTGNFTATLTTDLTPLSSVQEPGTLPLLGGALIGLGLLSRRRSNPT